MRTSKKLRRFGIALSLLSTAGAAVYMQSSQRVAAQDAGTSFEGIYLRDMSAFGAEETARTTAIAEGTASLEAEEQVRWRMLLEEITRPQLRFVVRNEGGGVLINSGTASTPIAGDSAVAELDSGTGPMDSLVQRVETATLLGEILPQPLEQTLSYSLDAEGQVLTLETRIEGGGLPATIEITGTYSRD